MPGMDEFGLIRFLTEGRRDGKTSSGVAVGIGDDAAVLNGRQGYQWVVSCDTMVEDVHFKDVTMTYRDIGFKAMASNVSDMAAMGAIPRFALIALSIPKACSDAVLKELYDGLYDCAGRYGTDVVGGDTTSSPSGLTITVTVIGEVERGKALLRSSAQPGDAVFVTGPVGLSAAGLNLLLNRGRRAYDREGLDEAGLRLAKAHQMPLPQVEAGRLLGKLGAGGALNDISDGLASESWEIAEASGCGLELTEEDIAVHPDLAAYSAKAGADPWEWMLYGGEDYQLIGTVPQESKEKVRQAFEEYGLAISFIGQAYSSPVPEVRMRWKDGTVRTIAKKGYNHFKVT